MQPRLEACKLFKGGNYYIPIANLAVGFLEWCKANMFIFCEFAILKLLYRDIY